MLSNVDNRALVWSSQIQVHKMKQRHCIWGQIAIQLIVSQFANSSAESTKVHDYHEKISCLDKL